MRDDEEQRKQRPNTRARIRRNNEGRQKATEDQTGQTTRRAQSRVGSKEQQSEKKKRPTEKHRGEGGGDGKNEVQADRR